MSRPPVLRIVRVLVLAGAVCLAAWPAEAQVQRAPRPYRGLFGGNEADPTSRQALDFSASLNFGYDDNVTGQVGSGGGFDPRSQASSGYLGGGAGLSYVLNGDRITFRARGSTSARLFTDLNDLVALYHGAAAGFSARLSQRATVSANQSVAFSPYYSFGLLPPLFLPEIGDEIPFNEDLVVDKREAWRYGTNVNLNHRLARRTTLYSGYSLYLTDFTDSLSRDLKQQSAHVGLSQALTQHASVRLGYGYRLGEYSLFDGSSYSYANHNIIAGVDYSRAFTVAFSRSTTFSFGTGSSITRSQTRTYARVVGNANLNHQLGRSWNSYISYQRGIGFRDGFDEPILSDSVLAGLGGYVGRRTVLSFGTGYSTGSIGAQSNRGYDTFYSFASMQYALTRHVAAVANYGFYHYAFDQARDVPPGVPQELDRQAFRVGLTLWVPLLR